MTHLERQSKCFNLNDVSSFPAQIKQISYGLTKESAFSASVVQLSGHNATNPVELEVCIAILITRLSDSLHTSIRMSSNQITLCVEDIISEYWYLKLEEVALILNNARKRKTFNRLDQSVVFECFDEYVRDRQSVVEACRVRQYAIDEQARKEEEKRVVEAYLEIMNGKESYNSMIARTKREKEEQEDDYRKFRASYVVDKSLNSANDEGESI